MIADSALLEDTLTREEMIEYLVERAFPIRWPVSLNPLVGDGATAEVQVARMKFAAEWEDSRGPDERKLRTEFTAELEKLSDEVLTHRFSDERAFVDRHRHDEKLAAKRAFETYLEDARRWPRPDHDWYCKFESWTLDEAAALLLDRIPTIPSRDLYVHQIAEYQQMITLLSNNAEAITDSSPWGFASWAATKGLNIPESMKEALKRLGRPIVDLRSEVANLSAENEDLREQFEKLRQQRSRPTARASQAKVNKWVKDFCDQHVHSRGSFPSVRLIEQATRDHFGDRTTRDQIREARDRAAESYPPGMTKQGPRARKN